MLHLKEVLNQDFPGLIQTKEISYDLSIFPIFPVIYPSYLLNSNPIAKNKRTNAMHCYAEIQPYCLQYQKAPKNLKISVKLKKKIIKIPPRIL